MSAEPSLSPLTISSSSSSPRLTPSPTLETAAVPDAIKECFRWLTLVEYNAETASPECLGLIYALAQSIPDQASEFEELQPVIAAIQTIFQERAWKAELKSEAQKALSAFMQQYPDLAIRADSPLIFSNTKATTNY